MPCTSAKIFPAIWVPIITIFKNDPEQSLDLEAHKKHILWLAQSGIRGFVCQGSTSEAVSLLSEERATIIQATRRVLDENGFEGSQIMAGAGANSTREAISLAKQAASSGADSVLCLPPSYFAPSITREALEQYYLELADNSPVPVFIYSWPSVSSGLEIDSDLLLKLSIHPNIAGYKGTDHNVGKMTRVRVEISRQDFYVLSGATDYFLPALAGGVDGTITGIGNITPRVVIQLYTAFIKGDIKEAQRLQGDLAKAEWALLKSGIPSMKSAANSFYGYGGVPRRPLPPSSETVKKFVEDSLSRLVAAEHALAVEKK